MERQRVLVIHAAGFKKGPIFADKYLDGETYMFAIERDGDAYTLAVTGKFFHGGEQTYQATRPFRGAPPIWHYNQRPEEYPDGSYDQKRTYLGNTVHTWPAGSSYPDYFFLGDPHINYYEGTADFDDLKLYLPE